MWNVYSVYVHAGAELNGINMSLSIKWQKQKKNIYFLHGKKWECERDGEEKQQSQRDRDIYTKYKKS